MLAYPVKHHTGLCPGDYIYMLRGLVLPLQLCIAKYNSGPSSDSVLFQDLIVGEGQGVEVGDSLEVAFTGWLFQNCGLGQVKLERELTAMPLELPVA